LEILGPVTAATLAEVFHLAPSETEAALLALEAEGFILRGKFTPHTPEIEWCDRRLLARIHRLTIHRLREEIQPVALADFQRFLLAWQRVDPAQHAEGPEGVQAVLDQLDGYELPAAAWEPEVLSRRIKDYTPEWLDQCCFTGRVGWGRLSCPLHQRSRPFPPLRSSPISLFARENLPHWLLLAPSPNPIDYGPDTQLVLEHLAQSGAQFFTELTRPTGLLPSRIEQALAELVAEGCATADSFEGLRALLVPTEKRLPLHPAPGPRRHRAVTSVERAGRWALLRRPGTGSLPVSSSIAGTTAGLAGTQAALERDEAIEVYARVLLRRYGVMFRRLLERESLNATWFELGRVYRRLEARGEIRGGYFVSGVSGEQFALPEAIGLLRSLRKSAPAGECITISAADPLNLAGILTPSSRVTALTANRLLLRHGVPVAALQAGEVVVLDAEAAGPFSEIERALRIGTLPAALRRYYA
jgi:ATP-dependent Lhr-like helicase